MSLAAAFLSLLIGVLGGCADRPPPDASGPLAAEAGLIEVEPVAFSFRADGVELDLVSDPARLFYSFHPAAESPLDRPLFVFFNGGPGCPTSNALLATNTAPVTLDPAYNGGRTIGPSAVSWARLGNLLYVDARMTGFSYGLLPDPADDAARSAAFDAQNFNPYLDAADVLRVLLRFLAAHPALRAAPVVLVGESYGGVRATLMLHMLLHPERYAGGGAIYRDDALVAEIHEHLAAAFPEERGRSSGEVAARQFGRQVLIQPLLSGEAQQDAAGALYLEPDSVLYRIADEVGVPWTPCDPQADPECEPYDDALDFIARVAERDIYAYPKPAGFLIDLFNRYGQTILDPRVLEVLLETDVHAIDGLGAPARRLAFRLPGPPLGAPSSAAPLATQPPLATLPAMARALARLPLAPPRESSSALRRATPDLASAAAAQGAAGYDERSLASALGTLRSWDRYFLDCREEIIGAFYDNRAIAAGLPVAPLDEHFGALFLENLRRVETFVTAAELDLVVYSAALPAALASHDAIVASVEPVRWPGDEPRPGALEIRFRPGALGPGPELRTVRFPRYERSGHGVEVFEPAALLDDVARWLAAIGESR